MGSSRPPLWSTPSRRGRPERAAPYALHFLLFGLMVLAALSARSGEVSWRWCLVAGIAARFILLPAPWFTSNDLFRYLWDGAAVLHGHDPWSESPLALAEGIDSPQPLPPDNTTVPSIYPPGAR